MIDVVMPEEVSNGQTDSELNVKGLAHKAGPFFYFIIPGESFFKKDP